MLIKAFRVRGIINPARDQRGCSHPLDAPFNGACSKLRKIFSFNHRLAQLATGLFSALIVCADKSYAAQLESVTRSCLSGMVRRFSWGQQSAITQLILICSFRLLSVRTKFESDG